MPRGRGGDGLRQMPAESAPLASPSYYERVGQLQQALRDSEKKRFDLEDKLYEYNKSDKCRAKLKCAKLKKYLKEVCESERRARVRNQGYLKKCECVQTYAEHWNTNTERLQKLKGDMCHRTNKVILKHIVPSWREDALKLKENMLLGLGRRDEDREKGAVQAGIYSGTSMSKGLYQPATIFMGRQMSAISSIDDFHTEKKSNQPTKNCSIPDPHSHQQTARSSCLTDSCVVQTNSDTQCLNKSDKIDGKTSLQIGEKTPVTSSVLSEEEQTHSLEIGSSTRHSKCNLSEGRESAELHSSLQGRLSPENRTTDLKCDSSSRSEGSAGEIQTQEHIEVREERASPPLPTLSVSEHRASANKCTEEKHSAWQSFSDNLVPGHLKSQKAFLKVQEEQEEGSSCSSSDLTVSISDDDLILENLESLPNPGATMEGKDGSVYLLISEAGARVVIYISTSQSYVNIHVDVAPESLMVSWHVEASQLLENFVRTQFHEPGWRKRIQETMAIRSEQIPDWHLLKTQEECCMKEHDNSLKEEATAFLKKVLTEECDHRSAIHSNESSCSMPSILNDNNGIKEAKPALRLNSVLTREQEVSSGCGDESKEESVAATPVTETKAYQLLKKSTLQDNSNQTEESFESQFSSVKEMICREGYIWYSMGLDIGSSTFKTKTAHKIASEASFSSSEGSPLSRHESKRDPVTTIKSNAFWGESDDSNSEIEAALRPRDHNMSDDFDDFYDT
ncbi:centrosomal protein kizuna isoform X1 [Sigmodon hispidus]